MRPVIKPDIPAPVPVKVTMTIEWDGRTLSYVSFIQALGPSKYAREAAHGAVRQMIRDVAIDAAVPFAAAPSKYTDDLFAVKTPEPPQPCCGPIEPEGDYPDDDDPEY